MSYSELVANARREAREAVEKENDRQLYISQQAGYDGLKLVATAVQKGLLAIANSARELLDDQYKSIALSLLETTLTKRWDKLALGSKVKCEEPLCEYYCQKGQPRCIDPHSKFACPVSLITGMSNCTNRPFYSQISRVDFNNGGRWSLDIEYQTEFITQIIFALFPQKRNTKPYNIFDIGDIIKVTSYDELKHQHGVDLYDDNSLRHEDYLAPKDRGIYYNYEQHKVYNYKNEVYDKEYKILNISTASVVAKDIDEDPKVKPDCLPIWAIYRVNFKGFNK